ncbi:MAG TPA: hypothetical protein VN086_00695 [Candidatus Paceibacterota bacterium]|nr:hypothetical protein [Candidatus Paceibacterota bacterium]
MVRKLIVAAVVAAFGCSLAQPVIAAPKHRLAIYKLSNTLPTRREQAIFNKLISDCKTPNAPCLEHAIIVSGLPNRIEFFVGYI